MGGLEQKYPGVRSKIEKARQSGYTDEMIENSINGLIYKSYNSDYTDNMIRTNLGVSKEFILPKRPAWWQKGLEILTGGHIQAPGASPPPELGIGGKVNIPETAKMGLFEDPITAAAFGTVAGLKAAAPVGKKLLIAGREALGWATGGLTDMPKLVAVGTEKAAVAASAKQVEKTMAGAFKTAQKGLGVKPAKVVKEAIKPGAKVMSLIKKRRTDIDVGILESESFIRHYERNLSTSELEAIPFIRQGIKDPEVLKQIGREDLFSLIKNPSTKLIKATDEIGKYYEESHEFLKQAWGEDIGFVENYVTQIWDIPKGKKSEALNYFAKNNPFLKKRSIPTYEAGIELGLMPKTTNIAKLLRIYDQYKIKTVHNFKFAESLKNMVDDEGVKLMMRSDKAPVDWIKIDSPALNRAMAVGTKPLVLTKVPVKINPEIAKEVKIIFDEPINNKWINAYETANAFLKKSMLSVSFFHHQALTESAFSAGVGKKAIQLWNPAKLIRALKVKDYEVFKQMDLAKDAITHNVTFGALEDIQRGKVAKALKSVEDVSRNIPGLRSVTKGMRKSNELWDAALWDYYHNSLKLYAYESNIVQALRSAEKTTQKQYGRSLLPKETEEIKNTIGLFINDSFGGQNWELDKVLGNPKMRQMMHWGLLAPDWTVSVLKQAAAPAKGALMMATAKGDTPKVLAGKALTKRGALFWVKAATYYNTIAQSTNYYLTQKEYGEGRFTWDNPPGNKLNIFIGRNEDGTERYLRMGKQFREVMEWGIDPLKKLGAKLAPIPREAIRQFSAHDPGSGYPTEWAKEDSVWKTIPERVKSVAEMPIPFSLRSYVQSRPGNFMFTFPTKRGMTNYKAVKLFKVALKKGSRSEVRKIVVHAIENKLNAFQLLKSANSAIKADITYEAKDLARDILNELNGMPPEVKQDAFELYKQRGTITPAIERQMDRLIKDKAEREQQQKLLRKGR